MLTGCGEGRSLPSGLWGWPESPSGMPWVGLLRRTPRDPLAFGTGMAGEVLPAVPSPCICLQPLRTHWPSCCRCCRTSRRPIAAAQSAPCPWSRTASWSCRREVCPTSTQQAPCQVLGDPWCTLGLPPQSLSLGCRAWVSPELGELGG